MRRISRSQAHLTVDHSDWKLSQPEILRRQALTGNDVELQSMPRAGQNLSAANPLKAPARTDVADHRAADRSLAGRPELMRAHVVQRVQSSGDVEDADLQISDPHNFMATRWEIAFGPNDVFFSFCAHDD